MRVLHGVPVLLIALASGAFAESENVERPVRAPQGHLKYSDPNGLKVNWKFFGNQQQGQRAEIEQSQAHPQPQVRQTQVHPLPHPQAQQQYQHPHPQQLQQQQAQVVQAQPAPVHANVAQSQPNYSPYSAVPPHIKNLIQQAYPETQRAYVDPAAFLYNSYVPGAPTEQQSALTSTSAHYEQPAGRFQTEESQAAYTHKQYDRISRHPGKIEYKEDQQRYQQQQQQQQQQQEYQPQYQPQYQTQYQQQEQHQQLVHLASETIPAQPIPKLFLDKSMPSEIQQLLMYQAQIPYDVIANRIKYTPKAMFIPKPIPENAKGPYNYRSKVYYMADDQIESEYPEGKPVEEDQRQ